MAVSMQKGFVYELEKELYQKRERRGIDNED